MASKTGIASLSQGRSDLFRVNPRDLHIKSGWNNRDLTDPTNVEHIDMLAKSIAEVGVKKPLVVYWEDGKAYVSDGHCRLMAAIRAIEVYKAEIKTVPVVTDDRYANEADRIFGQIVHNQGKPFSQLEQARVCKKLVDLGWSQNDIAAKAGFSAGRISQLLELLTAPEGVKNLITNGHVSATLAMNVVKNAPSGTIAEQQLKAGLEQAKSEGKTKIKPSHLEGAGEARKQLKTVIVDAFEYADVDDTQEDMVVIKMPYEQWNKLREAAGL